MAESIRRYAQDIIIPGNLQAGRKRLVTYLDDLYVRRLRLSEARSRVELAKETLEDPGGILVEMAHDGQLPHLGIVRMVLKAREVAMLAGNGLALYLVGDHYTAAMRPQNLLLGLPLRGVDADQVKNPLTVQVGRPQRHVPFHHVPPPSDETLDNLARRGENWIVNNASHSKRKAAEGLLKERLRYEIESLRESARLTKSFGDWLMRIQAVWFDRLFDGPPPGLAILPMQGIMDWVPDVLHEIAESEDEIDRIESSVRLQQVDRGETPYRPDSRGRTFWMYCPSCWRRYRAAREGEHFIAECISCGKSVEAVWPGDGRLMPDIVAFECALFRTGISGWIVGSRASYHAVIEELYRAMFATEMPPKAFVQSVPRFRGIGEPPDGHTRARLLRVLLEVEPKRVREVLEAPWNENPEIASAYV